MLFLNNDDVLQVLTMADCVRVHEDGEVELAKGELAARPRFAYLPFGGGPRVCIGNAFAMMEATILLAQIAQEYRLLLDPRQRVEAQGLITLRPRFGMRMILEPRVPQRS